MNTTKSKAPTGRERIERNIVKDRKTGHYLVTLYSGYNDNGIQRTTVTCHTLTEARQERDKHEYERKNLGKTSSNTQITVTECIEQYIAEKNLAETTKDNYNTRLKRIVKHPLGKKKLVSVKKIDITRYMGEIEREGHLSNRSINGDRRLLQTIFNYAIDCGYISQNVVNTVPKMQEETFEGTALTKEEVQALMQAIDDCQDKRLKVIVCLGALQGMRRGEIMGLKWGDISTGADGSRISIQRERVPVIGATIIEKSPKTKNSRRTIPLQPQTQRAVEEYRSMQTELGIVGEYVVVSNQGKPISPTHINNMFNKFLKQSGLQHIRLHDLRHTCCTLLIEHNAGFPVVSKYLGHSSSRTTERVYTHLRDSVTDNTVSIFTDIFGDM
jgi:integrase